MNIFAVNQNPFVAARSLPDRYTVKMPIESAQILAIIFSPHYFNLGVLHKKNGNEYRVNGHKSHPCTKWAAKTENLAWLILHAVGLCGEYTFRYNKTHGCSTAVVEAINLFNKIGNLNEHKKVTVFPFDFSVQDYQDYISKKKWVKDNYIKCPERKPDWLN